MERIKVVSCGFIIFRKFDGILEFLLIHSKFHGFWSFPKGRMEEGEEKLETALRELEEEVGINRSAIKTYNNFLGETSYEYYHAGKIYDKKVYWYLAELIKDVPIIIDNYEIDNYAWLDFESALNRLSFEKDKETLKKVYEMIT